MATTASTNSTRMSLEPTHRSYQDDESDCSDSSIDGAIEGTIEQRKDGPSECFCSRPSYVRDVQKWALRKEMQCQVCLRMLVLPVTLPCGHTFCKHCLLLCNIKRETVGCATCKYQNAYQHPLDIQVNVLLDDIVRQLNPKLYFRNLKKHEEYSQKINLKASFPLQGPHTNEVI